MADGPTVQQILKKRDADIAACEATAQQQRDTSVRTNAPLLESLKNLALYGPGGKQHRDFVVIEADEQICKAKAKAEADKELQIRETVLDVKAQSKSAQLEDAEKAIAIYRGALDKAERRAAVAETLAEACFFPKRKSAPRPAPKGDNGPQEATLRSPKR